MKKEYKSKYEREMEALEAMEDQYILGGKDMKRAKRLQKNQKCLEEMKGRRKSGGKRTGGKIYDEYEEELNEYRRYAM